ncbi:MAG: signal peptidase I [Candidatus Dormibacteria bacterium]
MAVTPSELTFPAPAPPPFDPPGVPAPPALVEAPALLGRTHGGRILGVAHHVTNLLSALVMLAALAVSALIGVAVVTGHHFETVITGSMQPQIPIGSLVMTQRVPASQLQVGDIIVFPAPCEAGKIVVHRVVQATVDGGQVLIQTKGDANAARDVWRSDCSTSQTGGALAKSMAAPTDRVVYVLPIAGNALDIGRRFAFVLLVLTGGLVVLGVGMREVRHHAKNRSAHP